MIDHTGIGVANVARAAHFYDAALGALGLRRVVQLPESDGSDGIGYGVDYPIFWIDRFHPYATRNHTAFAAKSRAEVDAFHAAALNSRARSFLHENRVRALLRHHLQIRLQEQRHRLQSAEVMSRREALAEHTFGIHDAEIAERPEVHNAVVLARA